MGQDIFLTVMKDALMTVLLLSAPALLVAIVVGFGVGLVQALTQIQDQTLPQAIKLVAVMLVLLVLGPLLARWSTWPDRCSTTSPHGHGDGGPCSVSIWRVSSTWPTPCSAPSAWPWHVPWA